MLTVMTFGYGGSCQLVEDMRSEITSLGFNLVTIHEWGNADIKWDRSTYLQELKRADIIILISDYERQPAKSNNRLTQSLALGKPVICSPLDSYVRIERENPGCCLFAKDKEELKVQLLRLKDDLLRTSMVGKALEVAPKYSMEVIGQKWADVIQTVPRDMVDIVIPTYKNLRGLKLCLESIRVCTEIQYKVVVINNGDDPAMHEYLSSQKDIVYKKCGRMNFSQAMNEGIKSGSGKYVALLNDDLIVSRGWLSALLANCKGMVGAVGPLSNCDKSWRHNYDIVIGGIHLLPGMNTYDEIEPIIPQIYDYQSPYKETPDQEWVAFYCTLIPREVINKVGLLDETFTNSGEDVDYNRRIRKAGYTIIQDYNSFVFHAGAVSRKILEMENHGSYHEADRQTNLYLNEKWGRENVVLFSGPSWERWSFKSVDEGGIGGSETWVVWLARALDKLGYRVRVFADTPEPVMQDGNIGYMHYTLYNSYIEQNWIDYFISSRTTDPLDFPVRAGKIFVQIHDIWLMSAREKTCLDKVTKYCVLSDWHRKFAGDYHKIPDSKMQVMVHGLESSRYEAKVERNPYKLIYSSSPDRGLDTLLYLFDFIRKEIPQAELHVFYGFHNWAAAVVQRKNEWEIKKMEEIKSGLSKPGVVYHGRVGQKELALEQLSSSLWPYFTDFTETSCITALEVMRAGVPVICSNLAGLETTVADGGILIGSGKSGESYTKEYREQALEWTLKLLKDRDLWKHWSEKAYNRSLQFTWDKVALMWQDLFKSA